MGLASARALHFGWEFGRSGIGAERRSMSSVETPPDQNLGSPELPKGRGGRKLAGVAFPPPNLWPAIEAPAI